MALGLAAGAPAEQSIQFAEPVDLSLRTGSVAFDAYGRRFALSLIDNERVLSKLPVQRKQQLARYRLLRGSLDGTPGSWARLTETPQGIEGAIWDGRELYAVTRYENIAAFLTTPLAAEPGQTVVYKLSDARNALPADFCANADVAESQLTALDQYQALVQELDTGIVTPTISRQIEIALLADSAFQAAEGADPTAAMMARLNIVEGIFSEQVGLLILATDIRLMPADSDPFTSTKGTTLLEQLGAYREASAAVRARGLAHLMTGKDLDGSTAGIAYVRTVCDVKRGVSVSQRSYGTTVSALIMAHELGHNFGAEHDGVPGTACAATPEGFIMAPSVSGYATFSQCSIDSITPVLASASCVTPAQFADALLESAVNSVAGEGGRPFTLPFDVRSAGNVTAEGVEVTVTLPASSATSIESASSSVGSCAVSGLTATCVLGDLAAGAMAQVNVIASGNTAASFDAQARVRSVNDRLSSNNSDLLPVTLRSGVDAAVSVSASATEILVGAPLQVYVDVSSLRTLAVRNATLSLNLNQPIQSASMNGASCNVNASSLSCSIPEIAAGGSRRLTVQASAQTAGPVYASAGISAPGDGDLNNNSGSVSAWVQAERDVELTASAGVSLLNVGSSHEIAFTLRSRGSAPTGDVTLLISLPATSLVVDSIEAGGAPCASPGANLLRCELGPLGPGASRIVRLRVHGTGPVAGDLMASAIASDDGYGSNNNATVQLRIDHEVDLAVVLASGGSGIEDAGFEGQVTLRSQGRQSATAATLDIELHAAGELKSADVHNGADCALLSATRARCTLPDVPRNGQVYVNYQAWFAEPGDYDVRFHANVPGDSAPDNDTLTRAVIVRPYLDAGLTGSLRMDGLYGGQSLLKTFTVTTDRRALASARFLAAHSPPALRVESISASVGDCRVDEDLGGICDFAGLPALSSTTVNVTYRAADGAAVVYPVVGVSTPGDVASGNDGLTARVETFGSTDLALRVATAVAGPKAATLTFPTIELVNGGNRAITPRLEVTLPAQVSVVEVSASNAVCSGTTTLRCDFDSMDPMTTSTVSLTVRASVNGSFVSQVHVSAVNDNNPANDSREVSLEISGSNAQVTASEGSGSGGGGRMEWLALLALALVKWGHSSFPSKRGQGWQRGASDRRE
jgi:hypothetical protein